MVSSQASGDGEFRCESDGQLISLPALDFSGIIAATGQKEIDIILVDIQGAETPLLENLSQVLQHSLIRFMVISTHDLEISGSAITHQSALDLLIQNGAHIILEHSVSESYSGDGFILASFMDIDKQLQIPISFNRSKNSLFGEWEPRMHTLQQELTQQNEKLAREHEQLTEQPEQVTQKRELLVQPQKPLTEQLEQLTEQYVQLSQQHNELDQQYRLVIGSTIWRATKLLRLFISNIKRK